MTYLDDNQTAPIPILTVGIIENLAQRPQMAIEERIDRALQAIGRPPAEIGKFVSKESNLREIDVPEIQKRLLFHAATECGTSREDFGWLLNEMTGAGLIGSANPMHLGHMKSVLALQGLNRLETGGGSLASRTAFVAMWFGSEVTDVCEKGIKPAITEAGYEPMRIDDEEHIDKIVAEIHRGRFVFCDLTCGLGKDSEGQDAAIARGSVCYEAGFAHGLDKPVIWTCREDLIGQAHFDMRQYSMISWKRGEEEKLRDALVNRIRAVIT
ncbi:MAG: hypothetical protein OXC91_08220 [Rhodobacteraceae bacterium]|nr:hypothetical protein [Paracoccaceae bacterium]